MEIYIYIEGAGNEDETELIPRQRPGFRSGIISGKETTRSLSPGFYSFFQPIHALEILKRLDANKVRQASPYCNRIFTTIKAIMAVSNNNPN
jgi:hypothetical protein